MVRTILFFYRFLLDFCLFAYLFRFWFTFNSGGKRWLCIAHCCTEDLKFSDVRMIFAEGISRQIVKEMYDLALYPPPRCVLDSAGLRDIHHGRASGPD